jgi:polar amino acid transport system substrate-binding protein
MPRPNSWLLALICMLFFFPLLDFAGSRDDKSIVTMCAEPWAPFDYREQGQARGMDIEVTKFAFRELGVEYKILIMPWKQCWEYIQKGTIDIGLLVAKSEDRKEFVYYAEEPNFNLNYVFFTNYKTKQDYKIDSCTALKQFDFKIGLTEGNAYGKKLWECLPYKDIAKAKTAENIVMSRTLEYSLKKLNWNNLQLVPMIKFVGIYNAKLFELENITYYDWIIFSKPYYTIFSKKSKFENIEYKGIEGLMAQFNKSLAKIKGTEEFKKIMNTYEAKNFK